MDYFYEERDVHNSNRGEHNTYKEWSYRELNSNRKRNTSA